MVCALVAANSLARRDVSVIGPSRGKLLEVLKANYGLSGDGNGSTSSEDRGVSLHKPLDTKP